MTSSLIPVSVNSPTTEVKQADVSYKNPTSVRASQIANRTALIPRPTGCADCHQEPWISIFFDGTGNNYDADIVTRKHSNVARLYDVHPINNRIREIYRIYIPGLGTYNRDISDSGDGLVGLTGNGVANRGEDRIKQAQEKLDEIIKQAGARANSGVNKIRMIHVALFGFSRGAALARAFARRLQNEYCEPNGKGSWQTKVGKYPFEIYFMGLLDTVASVGAPPAAKNALRSAREALDNPFNNYTPIGIAQKVFVSGIDTFLSQADGHVAWGKEMAIPDSSFVKHCEHMVAVHEFRNSFPVDLILFNGRYAPNCRESVYPGAHSNVGGGYRPGEGGKSDTEAEMLSQIPLRAMHMVAISKGVPLLKYEQLEGKQLLSVALDPILARRYNHYMQQVGSGNKPVNELYLSHMALYFRWRIVHVGRLLEAEKAGTQTEEEKKLAAYDAKIAKENAKLEQDFTQVEQQMNASRAAYARALREVSSSGKLPSDFGAKEDTLKTKQDEYYRKKQEVAQQPSVGKLAGSLRKNNKEFLKDSEKILQADPSKLSRYQRIIYDAWKQPALTDPEIIAFFDQYVHDSHAGFTLDFTHVIDPRILYQGGDNRLDLADSGEGSLKLA